MKEIKIATHARNVMVDITEDLARALEASAVKEGCLTAFVMHTTAGITINENADPDVQADILVELERLIPRGAHYQHTEGNADSHVKASLMGSSVTIPIHAGKMMLGTWQGVFLCEFDGPRNRRVLVQIQGQ